MAKIRNRERLRAKLRALPDAIRAEIKPALEKGAQNIADLAFSLAPFESGALRQSIDWSYGPPPQGARIGVGKKQGAAAMKTDLLISVYAGNDRAFYARWVEFGTQASTAGTRVADKRSRKSGATRKSYRTHPGTPAHPFFYPAYRALRKDVSAKIRRATDRAIKKVANGGH